MFELTGLARIRAWLARIAFYGVLAWNWWLGQLGALVPGALRSAGGRLNHIRWTPEGPAPGTPLPAVGDVRVVMASACVFVRRLDLPISAFTNVRDMLSLLIGRMTPFQAEDVIWDARVVGRSAAPGMMAVDLVVLPRDLADEIQAWAARNDLVLRSLTVETVPERPSCELLEQARSARAGVRRWRLAAAMVLIGAIVAVDYAWQVRLAAQEVQLAAAAAALRAPAGAAAERRREREMIARPAEIAREAATTGALSLLRELTARLPDDAQVVELKRDGRTVTMSGLVLDAPKLLSTIEQSALFEGARFTAPVSRSMGDNRDFFSIQFIYRAAAP